jgi:molybdopterin-biosynthesis enzyme MoeA-like protein
MAKKYNFYSVIIGTELLNGRRVDKHFEFLNKELLKRGFEHKANLVIKDEPSFIVDTFKFVKQDENSVMFSFGGIGATPDDYTREAAAIAFSDGKLYTHEEAKKLIENQFGSEAYPHRINMAKLPKGAGLLKNVVNNVPGFSLQNRYFFTPGFPQMSRPMVLEALDKYFNFELKKYSDCFVVDATENQLIDIMREIPEDVEFSSLPKFIGQKRIVEIYIASEDEEKAKQWSSFFRDEIKKRDIKIIKEC